MATKFKMAAKIQSGGFDRNSYIYIGIYKALIFHQYATRENKQNQNGCQNPRWLSKIGYI